MKRIKFSTNSHTKDTHFVVDKEDYKTMSKFNWNLSKAREGSYYVARRARKEEIEKGSPFIIKLHRQILNQHLKKGTVNEVVDHINRNTLDNRKINLRICSAYKNNRNSSRSNNKGIGLWGASWQKSYKKWISSFGYKNKTYVSKPTRYDTEYEAHIAAISLYKKITGKEPNL